MIFTLSHIDTFLLLIYNKKILLNVNALILIHQIHHYVPIHINNAPHAFGLMDRFHIIFTPKNGLMENNALNSALVMLLIVQYIYLLLKNTTHYLMAPSILLLLILTLKNLNIKFILLYIIENIVIFFFFGIEIYLLKVLTLIKVVN